MTAKTDDEQALYVLMLENVDWWNDDPVDTPAKIIAAGFVRHRELTERDELLDLPVGTILIAGGFSVQRASDDEPAGLDWYRTGDPVGYTAHEIPLPATLLHTPAE